MGTIIFSISGQTSTGVTQCEFSQELTQYNGQLHYVALSGDCGTQFSNYYVWYSTGGTYVNKWVVGPLGDTDPANINSYLPTSDSFTYPVGNWVLGVGSLDYFITKSEPEIPLECCTKIAATILTWLKYAEAVGLTTAAAP